MEEDYKFIITKKEVENSGFRSILINLIETKFKLNKHKPFCEISRIEYDLLKKRNRWVDVKEYSPKKKDRLKDEIGKFDGKKCCIKRRT